MKMIFGFFCPTPVWPLAAVAARMAVANADATIRFMIFIKIF